MNRFDPVRADDFRPAVWRFVEPEYLRTCDQHVPDNEMEIAAEKLRCTARAIARREPHLTTLRANSDVGLKHWQIGCTKGNAGKMGRMHER